MTIDPFLEEFRDLVSVSVPDAKSVNSAKSTPSVGEQGTFGLIGTIGTRHREIEPTPERGAVDWSRRHREHLARLRARADYDTPEQEVFAAFDRLVSDYSASYPAPLHDGRCAGCGDAIDRGGNVIALHNSALVHGGDCLCTYGRRWRGEAAQALEALGIQAPDGWTP
jgi:hypothetical protein